MSETDPNQADEREEEDKPEEKEPNRSGAEQATETARRMEESGQESPG